jgi:integrase/recombinase XerD
MDIIKELALYSIEAEKGILSKNTLISYKANIKAFLVYFSHKKSPEDITLKEIETYLMFWDQSNTKYMKINSLKSFFILRGYTKVSLDEIEMPKRIKTMPKKVPRHILIEAIEELDNRKHKAVLTLAYATGMWLSEILNLELDDIDFQNNKILVRNKKEEKNRTVVFSDQVAKVLLFYIKKFQPKKYLFNGQFKVQYEKNSALWIVKNYVGKQYNFHMIRNSHIYSLIESGTNFKDIIKHLGLSDSDGAKRLKEYKKYTITNEVKIRMPI